MIDLPEEFLQRMKRDLGGEYESFLASYGLPAARGIRVNTLKISKREFEKITPVPLDGEVPWEQNGFYTNAEGLGKSVAHAAGLYYVQEPSAMCAAPLLGAKYGERVLDLCSAPGGKGTRLAEDMRGGGVLVLNEIDFKRYLILRGNVERMGVKNSVVTNLSPERLCSYFESYFDKILVDAPCSGEGMFKKEANAIPEWSVKNVQLCAERQKDILNCADKALAGGGKLVYSTCTFAPEEDEKQIENFLKTHPCYVLVSSEKLLPHRVRGEGHYCALLEKKEGSRADLKMPSYRVNKAVLAKFREWEGATLKISFDKVIEENGKLFAVNGETPDVSFIKGARVAGVCLGGLSADGKRFEPSHTLAMSLKRNEVNCVEVDEKTALNYLRGLTFNCDCALNGWKAVTYMGHPLGWCKAVNGTAKNHLPKGLRI